METITRLLQQTEELLARAEENLGALQSKKSERQQVAEKLPELLDRYQVVNRNLKELKEELLGILARLAFLAGETRYWFPGDNAFEIVSPATIRTVHKHEEHALREFASSTPACWFYPLCERILARLERFLNISQSAQASELKNLTRFGQKLVALGKEDGHAR